MAPHARSCCGEPQGSQQGPRGYGGAPFSPILLPQDLNSLTWRCLVEGFGPTVLSASPTQKVRPGPYC